ncbi:hypothetical protein [Streptomyces sp. AA0539]|uniref:hypothetical protein n=1 Tax=Streptomyces sp. AA0539 TaxID=1210045 RepID=UPI0003675B60|nr:hypothetical protein [Streptomyces sp. AA0539]
MQSPRPRPSATRWRRDGEQGDVGRFVQGGQQRWVEAPMGCGDGNLLGAVEDVLGDGGDQRGDGGVGGVLAEEVDGSVVAEELFDVGGVVGGVDDGLVGEAGQGVAEA